MNIKSRITSAILLAFVGALLGFLVGFFGLALTINDYSLLPLIGGGVTGLFAVIGFLIGGEPASVGSVGSGDASDDERSATRGARAVFGKAVTDPVTRPDAIEPPSLDNDLL